MLWANLPNGSSLWENKAQQAPPKFFVPVME
jgi:hypothetical protein